jgi:protein-disulfide isomerase
MLAVLGIACLGFTQAPKPTPSAPPSKPAATEAGNSGLPTEATVNAFMQHMFAYDSNIQWKVLSIKPSQSPSVADVLVGVKTPEGPQSMRFYVLPGGAWAIAGEMIPFGADPFAPARAELAKATGPARGPADAATTIVEFSDLECPSCKAAQPIVDRLLTDLPNVRFIFQNFPLETLHPWAFKAATYADCVGRENNDAFWKFIHTVYQNQEQVTVENADQKLKEYATESGANGNQTATCAAQPATAERVRKSEALAMAMDVTGTPTLFVNGRKIQSIGTIPYDVLKSIVTATK